ncbi:sugar ABC transporter substrate-binding protein [Paenibacillus sp. MWE-103]|uniref:Sugar ABC transporter substrate-binding protein n=1 Tax=Paenibacillus artemisiicola TaxID=1172618 RepID=A0ABS3WBF6_9BACL|nr:MULTISPECIES: sugar ABC transporter substrate-binding protein [Paenibacillus]MBO7745639.1 sugar ABC transporter substrate-binding protein [Paenibacillus artemisiicola]SFI75853.1 multiple sugar transport system substrate-binding protein [Paenibacillus sp. UNC496MF]
MAKRKKYSALLLCGALSAGLLAGCGSNNESTGDNGAGSGDEQVTLRMIESLTSPKRTELIQASIDKFEAANPNIKVELISPPFDQADNKIRTMLGAKEDLDVVEVRDLTVAEFVNNGFVEPLNAYADKWSDYASVSAISKSVGSIGDKLYFIPNGLYERQLFYRADWFKEKGLNPPATWDELYETAKKLTDPSQNRYGFSFRGGSGSNGTTDAMILAYNGDNVNLEDSMFTKDGKTIFSTPEAKQAMDLYLKLYKDASPPDSINWGFQEQVQAFTSGVTGMLLQDPDVIQSLTEKMTEGTWATAPLQAGPSGKALLAAGGAGWGITANSKHKEEAWKLVSFLSSPDENTQFSKDFGLIPIHTSATEDDFFKSGPYKTLIDMSNAPDKFVNYKPPFAYPGTGQWGQTEMESGQALLLGQASLDDTLKKWDAYWTDQKSKVGSK